MVVLVSYTKKTTLTLRIGGAQKKNPMIVERDMKTARILFVILLFAGGVKAQTLQLAEVSGTVFDATHSAIPGATVTLTNSQTGFTRTVKTNDSGYYVFAQLPPGRYQLTATATGFARARISPFDAHVGSSLSLDVVLRLGKQAQTVEVVAAGAPVDTSTAGINQLINSQSIANLPLLGRDYRDLALLSPSAQVTPGLRGGLRLGGQQSDYSGLVIDGGDAFDNYYGENFGSLETKNLVIPMDAVEEFQVVTNGFAPEFGNATGGLLNVVTKSGTNDVHGSLYDYFRSGSLTANDPLGNPSNITTQNQFGGSIGMPIRKDKQFLFLAAEGQRQFGPLITQFASNVNGVAVPEYGISNLASLEGAHTQFQNLATVLGRYDWNINDNNRFSLRSFFSRNHTSGFTGGRGQNETSAAFDNTETFHNQGVNSVFTLNSSFQNWLNSFTGLFSLETRPRQPSLNTFEPEVQINDTGNFGTRFYLPSNGDGQMVQLQDSVEYIFGKHDIKFGADVLAFTERKDVFAGWSQGTYVFDTLANFEARQPIGFEQGFGLNGLSVTQAGSLNPEHQDGFGAYWQDKWKVNDKALLTYGLRWDGTQNPQPQSATPGNQVYIGQGPIGPNGSHLVKPPQNVPNDYTQFGPRIGLAYAFGQSRSSVVRAAWGLYYDQTPMIFFPDAGNERGTTLFCFYNPTCLPPGGFPNLWPSSLAPNSPLFSAIGPPSIEYVDPAFQNPRVSNLTVGFDRQFANDWMFSLHYAWVYSTDLRTGGFSTTLWSRNVVVNYYDQFGRAILAQVPAPGFGPLPADPTIGQANELASFGRANYNEFVASINKRFSHRLQFFANYTLSNNNSNASSERDTTSFFGPQDPFNLNLDYGRSELDVRNIFNATFVYDLPRGFTLSNVITAHSGIAYPAYILQDINGDGVSNQGVASNDRPTVYPPGGKPYLLPDYPARQPGQFENDFQVMRSFHLSERYTLDFMAQFFNLFNTENLYSNADNSAFVNATLTAPPVPGQIGPLGTAQNPQKYRTLDQIAPGTTPLAAQLALKLSF